MYRYHNFLIHLSANGHLGCFYVLVIVNSAAMKIGVHVFLSILVSLVCMPSSGITESYGSSGYGVTSGLQDSKSDFLGTGLKAAAVFQAKKWWQLGL